jgi:hypothetical protein
MARENKKFYLSRVSFLDVINVIKNAVTGSLFVSDHHQNPVRLVVLETAITVTYRDFPIETGRL